MKRVSDLKVGDKLLLMKPNMAGYSQGDIVIIHDIDDVCIGFDRYLAISKEGIKYTYKYINEENMEEDLVDDNGYDSCPTCDYSKVIFDKNTNSWQCQNCSWEVFLG